MTSLGPMVYRSAHVGAVALILASVQFVLGMAYAQYLDPGYSLTGNTISDLGYPPDSAHGLAFNLSIRVLGILSIVGAFLVRSAFSSKSSARIGWISLALGGLAAVGVGVFPEQSPFLNGSIHDLVAALTFFFSGLALVFFGLAMVRDTRWRGMRAYTFLSGLVTWVAMGLYIRGFYLGIGPGGMERLVVAPILLWAILAGVHLLRIPRYTPQPVQGWGGSNPSG